MEAENVDDNWEMQCVWVEEKKKNINNKQNKLNFGLSSKVETVPDGSDGQGRKASRDGKRPQVRPADALERKQQSGSAASQQAEFSTIRFDRGKRIKSRYRGLGASPPAHSQLSIS